MVVVVVVEGVGLVLDQQSLWWWLLLLLWRVLGWWLVNSHCPIAALGVAPYT